jgi:hypothetical protein
MKSKLIIALLACIAAPCIATAPAAQTEANKPQETHNTQLLARLLSAKAEIQYWLEEMEEMNEILEEHKYKKMTQMWHELYDIVQMSAPKWSQKIHFFFNHICTQPKRVDEIGFETPLETEIGMYMNYEHMMTVYRLCYGTLQPHQEQPIRSILKKYGVCPNNKNSNSIETLLNDFFDTDDTERWELGDIGLMLDMNRFIHDLLPKIDAKIAELTAQI